MSAEIVWSENALSTFEAICHYLQLEWNEAVLGRFRDRTSEILEHIAAGRIHGAIANRSFGVRSIPVTRHNRLYYQQDQSGKIELLLFWDTRQNPDKLPY